MYCKFFLLLCIILISALSKLFSAHKLTDPPRLILATYLRANALLQNLNTENKDCCCCCCLSITLSLEKVTVMQAPRQCNGDAAREQCVALWWYLRFRSMFVFRICQQFDPRRGEKTIPSKILEFPHTTIF